MSDLVLVGSVSLSINLTYLFNRESGLETHRKPFLPKDKQYLITRNIPCSRRAFIQDSEHPSEHTTFEEESKSGWIITNDLPKLSSPRREQSNPSHLDTIMTDIDPANAALLLTAEDLYADDMTTDFQSNLIRTRTYDLSISYDKYYQVPRLWLQGYDEQSIPLKAEQIFEDVSQEHAKRTITMESHPHLPIIMASIHPCKHANVMKKMMEVLQLENPQRASILRVDQYLVLFLKFIASVLPTIDYDYTMSLD